MIYIYASPGISDHPCQAVDPACAEFTEKALLSMGIEKSNIGYLHNKEALAALSEEKPIVIIPGGRFAPLMEDLLPISDKINSLVKKGGSIIGICSGAMLLCSQLIKENDLFPLRSPAVLEAISPTNYMGPFGLASLSTKSPVFRHPNGTPIKEFIGAEIEFLPSQTRAIMPFNQGSAFLPQTSWYGTVTAKYLRKSEIDGNIAAWHSNHGAGKVVGIGFHPELPIPGTTEAAGLDFLRKELEWAGAFATKEPS